MEKLRICIGLPAPPKPWRDRWGGLSLKNYYGNPLSGKYGRLVDDVQRVLDFDSFKLFLWVFGLMIIYRRPDGSLNPILRRWINDNEFILDENHLLLIWDEEKPRFKRLQGDIEKILSEVEQETSETSFGLGLDAFKARIREKFSQEVNTVNKNISDSTIRADVDDSGEPVLLVFTPTLEAATFLTMYILIIGGTLFRKCQRQSCPAYFFSNDSKQRYCNTECQVRRNKEQRSALSAEQDKLIKRAYRKLEKKEINPAEYDKIRDDIRSTRHAFTEEEVYMELNELKVRYGLLTLDEAKQ